MNKTPKNRLLIGLPVIALLLYGVIRWLAPTQELPVADKGYYTGPMLRKSGIWVTADGKIVPPPADWKPAPPSTSGQQTAKPRIE